MDQPLIDVVEWSVNLAFWGSLAFPLVIAGVWPWWRDWFGRTMVAFDWTVAGVTVGLMLHYDFGIDASALSWIAAISLSASFVVLLWRTFMIFREQRRSL